jgi:hypothetical protein
MHRMADGEDLLPRLRVVCEWFFVFRRHRYGSSVPDLTPNLLLGRNDIVRYPYQTTMWQYH